MVRLYRRRKAAKERRYFGKGSAIFWGRSPEASRTGIYMKGGCDLPSVFSVIPTMQQEINGTFGIGSQGTIADSRSDLFFLQTLEEIPSELLQPVVDKLGLHPDYFTPTLFEKTFTVEGPDGPEEFSKDVVVLSMAPDVMRTLYRHRQHGFLVDPGGSWFNSNMRQVLRDLDKVVWFRKNFEPIGEMTVQGYADNLFKIIQRIKQDVGAHVLVYNVLTVEPGSNTYNYQFVRDSQQAAPGVLPGVGRAVAGAGLLHR